MEEKKPHKCSFPLMFEEQCVENELGIFSTRFRVKTALDFGLSFARPTRNHTSLVCSIRSSSVIIFREI